MLILGPVRLGAFIVSANQAEFLEFVAHGGAADV
jgi:hypothetical protein